MSVAQMFETTVVSNEGEYAMSFVSVPHSRTRTPVQANSRELAHFLGGEFLLALDEQTLTDAFAWTMASPAMAVVAGLSRRQSVLEPSLIDFASETLEQTLLPVEQSPIQLSTLSAILAKQSGMSMGAGAALVGFWGNPLLILAVPGGIILGGAAEGVARALNKGLRRRIEQRLLGRKYPPPRAS